MGKKPKKPDPLRWIAYTRASDSRQELSPHAQREAIEAYARTEGATIVAWHEEVASTGDDWADRSALQAALADVVNHGAGVLIAAKRDRVARNTTETALTEYCLGRANARLRSADGASEGASPIDALVRSMLDAIAQFERAQIRSRTVAALRVKRARGERTGSVRYGYRLADDGRTETPDEGEQATMDTIRELRASGMAMRAIVSTLAERGVVSRVGTPLTLTQVARLLA